MSFKNYPDEPIKATYQEVEIRYGTLPMLTYTSTALVSLLLSFGSASLAKIADCAMQLQPAIASQSVEISSAQSPHSISHRGSGRTDYRMMS
jgi:hypothetical protein